jgi:hypothetical protein
MVRMFALISGKKHYIPTVVNVVRRNVRMNFQTVHEYKGCFPNKR